MMDERPVTENSASEKEVREAKRRAGLSKRKHGDDKRAVIKTPQALRELGRILDFIGVHRQGYLPGDQAQFRDGMQNVGAFIIGSYEEAGIDLLAEVRAQRLKDTK